MYMYDEKDGGGIPADPHDYQGESLKEAVHPKMEILPFILTLMSFQTFMVFFLMLT